MKKIYLTLVILGMVNISFAQIKSSGVVAMGPMSLKIDLNSTNSLVTLTMTGPSTVWLTVGFNTTTMSTNTPIDCFTYDTSLLDQYLAGGHNPCITDANNLTLISNIVNAGIRTVVATRPFNTGDINDYTFDYNTLSNLNLIWAIGPSTDFTQEHSNFGTAVASLTLGIEDFASLDKINVYPNPSNGVFNIIKSDAISISKIKIFDTNAKLLKQIDLDVNNQNSSVNLSDLSTGIYFMEISNETDKAVKKIMIH